MSPVGTIANLVRLLWRFRRLPVALGSAAWLAASVGWFRGVQCVPLLREIREGLRPLDRYPSVSVVVPARDEEANVGAALGSLLDQDYPGRLWKAGSRGRGRPLDRLPRRDHRRAC